MSFTGTSPVAGALMDAGILKPVPENSNNSVPPTPPPTQVNALEILSDHGNASKPQRQAGRKRKSTDDGPSSPHSKGVLSTAPSKKPKKSTTSKSKSKEDLPDISDIHLDGESTESVPIFDSCDEMRRKINRFLRAHPKLTKTEFLRQILRAAYADPPDLQYKYLHDFLQKKGPDAGASTKVYYAAYVYLEKVRIKEGKPKSKHRQSMEEAWRPNGMPREKGGKTWSCFKDERPYMDQFGKVTFLPKSVGGRKW